MKRAFTLLETLLALAILGVSLLAVLNVNAQAVAAHIYAKRLSVATLLARGKMIDLEQKLHDEGLSADDEEESGDFREEGWSSYKWRAKIIAPKTNGLSPDQLFGALFNLPIGGGSGKDGAGGPGGFLSALFGAGGGGAGAAGLAGAAASALGGAPGAAAGGANPLAAAMGPMAGIAQAQFTQMVDQLQRSVREVHLTVSWKEGKVTESFDLVTHVVSLGKGSDRNGGAVAAAGGSSGSGTYVRADNGQPVPSPQPSPNGGGMIDPRDGSPAMTAEQYQAVRGGLPSVPALNVGQMPRPLVPSQVFQGGPLK